MRSLVWLTILSLRFFLVSANLRSSLKAKNIAAVFPGDQGYAAASQAYNQRFTVQPAAVTYPDSDTQVSQIVQIGVNEKLRVVARSGGHSYIANGLGGTNNALVVDLKNLTKITVNGGGATIETGNRLGDIATALTNAGKALPHGTCPYVGIGGHSAFGGFGFTSRQWGLTLDTITAINVVLPNGTIATASATSHPDLFWGLRGAAPSFGITTSIEVNTFSAPPSVTVFTYTWTSLPVTDAANAIAAFQSFSQTNIPPQLGGEINLRRGSVQGTVYLSLVGGWYDDDQKLDDVLAPLLSQLPQNPQVYRKAGSYIDSVIFFSGAPSLSTTQPDTTDNFYAKSIMTPQSSPMSDKAIKAFVDYLANTGFSSDLNWFCQVELYGGTNSAINNVAPDATAFVHRNSIFTLQLYASKPNNAATFPQSGFSFVDGIANSIISNADNPQTWPYGAYTNYIDDKLANWQVLYYGDNYPRLRQLKDKYDPKDAFLFPTSIQE